MVDKEIAEGYQAISKDLKLKIEKGIAIQRLLDKVETSLCLTILEDAYKMKVSMVENEKEKEKKV